jgi:hypothetical protein
MFLLCPIFTLDHPLLTPNLVTILFATPPLHSACSCMPNSCHMGFLIGDVSGNGVTISTLRCCDETESILWVHTQGYATWHALVLRLLVMIHYETTLMSYLLIIFPWLSSHILSEDLYVRPNPVELPSKVVKRITFEEQVTDININRLQEIVDK